MGLDQSKICCDDVTKFPSKKKECAEEDFSVGSLDPFGSARRISETIDKVGLTLVCDISLHVPFISGWNWHCLGCPGW